MNNFFVGKPKPHDDTASCEEDDDHPSYPHKISSAKHHQPTHGKSRHHINRVC